MFDGIGIYKIISPLGRIYIGSSKNLKVRMRDYRSLHCKSQYKLYNSLLKYGVDNHEFEVICNCELDKMLELEAKYGLEYNVLSKENLNLMLPKISDKYKNYSEEALLRKSILSTGRIMSKESKLKISEKNKGNKHSLGHKHSEETKQKISESQKGNKYNLGKKYSKDRIEKARLNRKPLSKDSRDKITNSSKKLVINLETGIYYESLNDACFSLSMKKGTLSAMLLGKNKNKTSFMYI